MTSREWREYAVDLDILIERARAIVYTHTIGDGTVLFVLQPRRQVDITRIRFPRRPRPD